MSDISRCDNKECIHSNTCLRFHSEAEKYQGYLVDFKNICESSDYQYLIQTGTAVIPTEENNS